MLNTYSVAIKQGEFTLRPQPRTYDVRTPDGVLIGSVVEELQGWRVPTLATSTRVFGTFDTVEEAVQAVANHYDDVEAQRCGAQRKLMDAAAEIRAQASDLESIASKR